MSFKKFTHKKTKTIYFPVTYFKNKNAFHSDKFNISEKKLRSD